MRIGIDIDGVLTNLEQFVADYFTKFCVEKNIDYKLGEIDYEPYKTFNVSKEQEEEFWLEYLEFYALNEKARPFATDIIKKLKEDGHEIYVITARWLTNRQNAEGQKMREIVSNWLAESNIIYDKLIFSKADKENKVQEIVENNIDLMIEDSPNNIKMLSKIVPIICYNAEYNKNCVGDNIYHCTSWFDIYKKIMEINK